MAETTMAARFHQPSLKATYNKPAKVWESEALPIGNGYMGVMTVEDLWSLRVEDLDAIFKMLNRQKKTADEDSLLATKSAEDQDLANKIDIVRYIVSVKLAEAAERVSAAEKKAQRDKIMEIVAKKKDKALEDMGIEDLMKKLEELN